MIKSVTVNRALQFIGVLLLGATVGYFVRPGSSDRFAWDKDGTYVLDKKTGQMCVPVQTGDKNLPACVELYKHY